MSQLIKILPDNIANQIAAGEVIQRPASVVKELMENAIDAGSTSISVIIKDAGKTLIQVIDNGSGMNEKDAILCFERHATSKLNTAEDLFNLSTKGFRGEALASIAAIAHVTLKTRQKEFDYGHGIEIEGSRLKKNEPCTCAIGSSFEIRNLFYNVPARRNFLKSDTVEFNHILTEFERIALAHPELSFRLLHNDAEIYHLNAAVLRKRIVDVLGRNTNDRLVPIDERTDIIEITGFVCKPEFAKKSRGEQFLFVNDRFFKDSYFGHAINKAFDGLIASQYFPSYFLYFKVDPKKIDVNVHPTKTEIKFEEDKHIYSILVSSVRQALGKYNISPTLDFERESSFDLPFGMNKEPITQPTIAVDPTYNPFKTTSQTGTNSTSKQRYFTEAIHAEGFGNQSPQPSDWSNFYTINDADQQEQLQIELNDEINGHKSFIFKDKYIVTTCVSGLMYIHTTRALERIIYDELMTTFIASPIASQQLLFPLEKEISVKEIEVWKAHENLLNRLGFFGKLHVDLLSIEAVPSLLDNENILSCLDQIFDQLTFQEIDKGEIAHAILLSIAKATSKSKAPLKTNEEAIGLTEQLFACKEHAFSPSGKKILETISLNELNAKL